VILAAESAGAALPLAVAAGVSVAGWLVFLGVLAVANRPRDADPGPAAMELFEEPPAVVSLLVNDCEVGREAVPATLLDLAARRVLSIDQVEPERYVCRLRPSAPPDLEPYEEQVLDHVRGLAGPDGVVPCEALTTGPEEESKGWWKRFDKAVVADCRERGLTRSRWSRAALAALGVAALVPAVLAAVAVLVLPGDGSGGSGDAAEGVLGLGVVVWSALMALPVALGSERNTPAGVAATSRWLGLRRFLAEDRHFAEQPPAAVAIWDRYLSYGAALGVAAAAVRGLPLGSESDRVAWSSWGGRWHMVRVRYPCRVPPGWGQHPARAAAIGLFWLVLAAVVARAIAPPLVDSLADVLPEAVSDPGPLALFAIVFASVLLLVVGVALFRSAVKFALGTLDLFARRQVEGLAVRVRNPHVAVDDGTRTRVRAWLVTRPELVGAVSQGSVVRARVSPWLGHVFSLERAGATAAGPAPSERTATAAAAATAALPPNVPDLVRLAGTMGVTLNPVSQGAGPDGLHWTLSDGRTGMVMVHVHTDGGADEADPLLGPVLGRLLDIGREPVPGMGDGASWTPWRNTLVASREGRAVAVAVGLPDLPPERRLDLASALGRALL